VTNTRSPVCRGNRTKKGENKGTVSSECAVFIYCGLLSKVQCVVSLHRRGQTSCYAYGNGHKSGYWAGMHSYEMGILGLVTTNVEGL
jgi:hypothetical protein